MGNLLADAAEKARDEINLADMLSVKIVYKDGMVLCRQIMVGSNGILLAVLADPPAGEDFDRYNDQLLNWAVENSLKSLGDLLNL